MKVTFKRNVDCDFYDHRMDETYPKYYRKWDELLVEAVENDGGQCNIALYDGDTLMNVPRGAVEVTK
jgi:hypothetical protein